MQLPKTCYLAKTVNTEKKDTQLFEVFPNQPPRCTPRPSAQPSVSLTSDVEGSDMERVVDTGEINHNILQPNDALGDERLEDINKNLTRAKARYLAIHQCFNDRLHYQQLVKQ